MPAPEGSDPARVVELRDGALSARAASARVAGATASSDRPASLHATTQVERGAGAGRRSGRAPLQRGRGVRRSRAHERIMRRSTAAARRAGQCQRGMRRAPLSAPVSDEISARGRARHGGDIVQSGRRRGRRAPSPTVLRWSQRRHDRRDRRAVLAPELLDGLVERARNSDVPEAGGAAALVRVLRAPGAAARGDRDLRRARPAARLVAPRPSPTAFSARRAATGARRCARRARSATAKTPTT